MTTTQESSETEVEEYPFEAKIDPSWALSLEQVLAVALFGVLFIVLSYVPLRATDLWCHVAYGQWILDHRQLPVEDPAMPLARGMQVIDTAWLAQVALGAVDRYLGPEALSHLFALVALVTYVIWARVFYLQSQRVWLCVLATALLIFVGWSRLTTVRPETFAMLCCAVLFWLIARQQFMGDQTVPTTTRPGGWLTWIGVPFVFVLWANLHGSFVIGLLVLACFFLGRVIEVLWTRRSVMAVVADAETRRWLYLTELALLATLINPYGLDLWIHTAKFSANPNLRTISEWQPLVILGPGGRQFAISIVLLVVVWRHSRRPIRPAEVLLLGLFAVAAISGIRMIGWYAPVFAFVLTPHLADIAGRLWPIRPAANNTENEPTTTEASPAAPLPLPGHSFRYSLVALLIIWIVFAVTPISQRVFSQRARRTPEQLYGKATPVALARFLQSPPKDNPLARKDQWDRQVFHPQWWGDWLDRAGPREFKPFVTTNIHLVPQQVWNDYLRVMGLQSGWERTLDRYHVGTIVVDKKEQPTFFSSLKRHSDWQNVYEDEQSAVFVLRSQRTRESQNDETPTGESA